MENYHLREKFKEKGNFIYRMEAMQLGIEGAEDFMDRAVEYSRAKNLMMEIGIEEKCMESEN